MEEVAEGFSSGFLEAYNSLISILPLWAQNFINLFLLVSLIVIYCVFIWKFYRFISTKNFFGLNLNKYNKSENLFSTKLLAGALYFLEYIIILPFLIFIIFGVFTLFLIILAQEQNVSQILIISAVVIAAIRMTAYYKEELSQEIAKFLPFTLLAITVLNPNTFSQTQYFERIISHLSQIPSLFSQIMYYLVFIIILEIILRFFDFIFSLFGLEEVEEIKKSVGEEEGKEGE